MTASACGSFTDISTGTVADGGQVKSTAKAPGDKGTTCTADASCTINP